jgi:hypothetical protein
MRVKRGLGVMFGAVLLLRGAPSSAQGASDACSLLTQARVGAALGVPVAAGQHLVPSKPSSCGWAQATERGGKRVVVDMFAASGGLSAVDRFNNAKAPMHGVTKNAVSGVGDEAYFITTPGVGTALNVKKGSSVFQIRVYGFSAPQIMAIEKALAQDALARL